MSSPPPAPIEIVEAEIVSWRAALDKADLEIAELRAALASKTYEEETVRLQLATTSYAAEGHVGAMELKPGERGHSHALVSVARLRRDWERLRDVARGAVCTRPHFASVE